MHPFNYDFYGFKVLGSTLEFLVMSVCQSVIHGEKKPCVIIIIL